MKPASFTQIVLWILVAGRLLGAEVKEDFASDPLQNGWHVAGNAGSFRWDESAQDLQVTWDSTLPNSFIWRSLGTVLTRSDDVRIAFDLQLDDITVGVTPGQPFTFELAVGLSNLQDATSTNFVRGNGLQSPNLMEFDYFPDSGFGATISPTIVSSNGQFATSFTFPLALVTGVVFHVEMIFTATNQTLTTTLQRDGAAFGSIKNVTLQPSFTDFRLDTFAIASYSDRGADGSVRAHGVVDNISVSTPAPPQVQARVHRGPLGWGVAFNGISGWTYVLERTVDWKHWESVSGPAVGVGELQTISDEQPAPTRAQAFYRLRLERP